MRKMEEVMAPGAFWYEVHPSWMPSFTDRWVRVDVELLPFFFPICHRGNDERTRLT